MVQKGFQIFRVTNKITNYVEKVKEAEKIVVIYVNFSGIWVDNFLVVEENVRCRKIEKEVSNRTENSKR